MRKRLCCIMICITAILLLAGCQAPDAPQPRWHKGNLHAHSLWSDGDEFPEVVAEWYRDHGYHFLAISDHNVFQKGQRWLDMPTLRKKGGLPALRNYLQPRSGSAQTRGQHQDGTFAVRLRTFDEMSQRLDAPGRFLLIPAEEISDAFAKLPVHLNGLNITKTIPPKHGASITQTINNNVAAVAEHGRQTNRPTLTTVNHPNFGWALAAQHLAESNSPFFEVYNAHPSVNHLGDARHPPVERLWDLANTIRLAHLGAQPLLGMACDDAHNYQEVKLNKANPGRGWIMVRCPRLSTEAILAAIAQGDFYASSGVRLREIRQTDSALEISIEPDGKAVYTTQFIGTLADPAQAGKPSLAASINPRHIGTVLATVIGPNPRYTFTGKELYVRAVVTSSKFAQRPAYGGQLQQAWTQPVGWARWLAPKPVTTQTW